MDPINIPQSCYSIYMHIYDTWILWVIIHHNFIEIPGFMRLSWSSRIFQKQHFHQPSPRPPRPAAKRYTSISACLLSCRAEPRQGLSHWGPPVMIPVMKAMVNWGSHMTTRITRTPILYTSLYGFEHVWGDEKH